MQAVEMQLIASLLHKSFSFYVVPYSIPISFKIYIFQSGVDTEKVIVLFFD